MSEKGSRYWVEVEVAVAARNVLTDARVTLPGDLRKALDVALEALEDLHYSNHLTTEEGMCGMCSVAGEHADEDCPHANDDEDGGDDEDEGDVDLERRAVDLGRFSGRCIGILDTDPRHHGIALRAAAIEKARGWVAHDEAGYADLLRQALRDTLGIDPVR